MKIRNFILIISFFITVIYSCNLKNDKQEYGEFLIKKVETFHKLHNRIPENVSEIGLLEEIDSPAFYQKENDSTYIIWYGLSVGESNVYNSSTKKWTKS